MLYVVEIYYVALDFENLDKVLEPVTKILCYIQSWDGDLGFYIFIVKAASVASSRCVAMVRRGGGK